MASKTITIDQLIEDFIIGGKDAVSEALKEGTIKSANDLTLNDLKMDSLDVVQLTVKVQDDLGITLSDDEFAKVPDGKNSDTFKAVDKVTLEDIAGIINAKLADKKA
jgi:acyl carrier protein